jgi:hypothetical protein
MRQRLHPAALSIEVDPTQAARLHTQRMQQCVPSEAQFRIRLGFSAAAAAQRTMLGRSGRRLAAMDERNRRKSLPIGWLANQHLAFHCFDEGNYSEDFEDRNGKAIVTLGGQSDSERRMEKAEQA